jgi:hypothetical protein
VLALRLTCHSVRHAVDSIIRLPLHMMSRVERLLAELIATTIEPAPRLFKSVEEKKKNDVGECNPILQEARKRNLLPFALERANSRLAQLRWCVTVLPIQAARRCHRCS